MNEARKTKWLWHFAKVPNALWRNVMGVKYGVDILCWWLRKGPYSYGVGRWRSVRSYFTSFEHFKSLVHFEVKNGSRVFFWHDVWRGSISQDSSS